MDATVTAIVHACTVASDQGTMRFPQIVQQLIAAGVERYDADLCRAERTYYLPSGASCVVPCVPLAGAIAQTFSAPGVEAAVRASQAGQITYHEFCRRIAVAGCVSYVVSLTGRRAVYSGRTGEAHVELFPGS